MYPLGMSLFTGSFVVTIYDTDCSDRLKYSSLCNFLQECSRCHGEQMGLGYRTLSSSNQTWLLNSIRIELLRQPLSGEQLQIKTWSRGTRGLRALRDFQIHDNCLELVGAASTEWILIDKGRMRPCRPGEQFPVLSKSVGSYPLVQAMGCFDIDQNLVHLDERRVRYNEIDVNGHVNNARYISWIEDTVGGFLSVGHHIKAIELHFLQGAKLDDQVEIQGTHAPFCPLTPGITTGGSGLAQNQVMELRRILGPASTPLVRACVEWG